MNNLYPQAPISKLHTDVMWRIFAINADMDNDFKSSYQYEQVPPHLLALNVLRNSAQVCQRWRELILGSPSLWGCVIELRCLQQKRGEWREEVIKRAGESFLSIKGRVGKYRHSLQDFVLELLKNHWPRVRKIDIELKAFDPSCESTWTVFQRPAPYLQLFRVYFQQQPGPLPDRNKPIFSDNAPLLQEFNLHPTCPPMFRLQAPWLSQLRKLSFRNLSFNVNEILDSLARMPLLEGLDIQACFTGVEQQQWTTRPCITLPRMTQLTCLDNDIRSCFYLLYHISPAHGCFLYIHTDPAELTTEEATIIRQVLVRYAQNYFKVHSPPILCLSLNKEGFVLHQPFTERRYPYEMQSLFLVIRCRPSSTIPLFLISLSPFISSNLARFHFATNSFGTGRLSNIIRLFESMHLLETLYSSPDGLRYILNVSRHHPHAVFPLVRKLDLASPIGGVLNYEDVLPEFLIWRKEVDAAVEIIDITVGNEGRPQNWAYLEEIVGLKVVWMKNRDLNEYVCGSGTPERLNLK